MLHRQPRALRAERSLLGGSAEWFARIRTCRSLIEVAKAYGYPRSRLVKGGFADMSDQNVVNETY